MPRKNLFLEIEDNLGAFRYVGDILAAIRGNNIASIEELISYYLRLWETTEALTDEELNKKNDVAIERDVGEGQVVAEGRAAPEDVDSIIESLRNREIYLEQILLAIQKRYPSKFPKNVTFREQLKKKP